MKSWDCRSSMHGITPAPRPQSTGSVLAPGPDGELFPKAPRATMTSNDVRSNGATLKSIANEDDVDNPDVLIVRIPRRTYWFNGPIARLPKREVYISPTLLSLVGEDE